MNDSNDRDNELDKILSPLRKVKPAQSQLEAWKLAVQQARTPQIPWYRGQLKALTQIAAAAAVGFVIGAWTMSQKPSPQETESNYSEASATIQYTFAKAR